MTRNNRSTLDLLGLVGFLVLGLAWCAPSALPAQSEDNSVKGHLILNGGGAKPAQVMETFVETSGGKDARLVVIPTASGEPDTGEYYVELLQSHGAGHVEVLDIRSKDQASDPKAVEMLSNADGVFFSGGDQRRITAAFLDTPALQALRKAYAQGAVLGGTSAGTACMSELMLTGDGQFDRITAKNVVLTQGLGFFPQAILDQHFVARQRQNRLLAAVLEHPERLGIGVDEGTAVWLRPDETFKVLGNSQVLVYQVNNPVAQKDGPTGSALGSRDLTLHLLLPGDVFDLRARKVVDGD